MYLIPTQQVKRFDLLMIIISFKSDQAWKRKKMGGGKNSSRPTKQANEASIQL